MNEELHQDEEFETEPLQKEINQELFWEDYEYDFQEKTSDWFWIFGTIAVLLIIISIILKDFLLGLIIFLGAFILGTHAKREPQIVTYGLAKTGIKLGHATFPYRTIRSFWVDINNDKLIIESGRLVKPHITIPLGGMEPEEIRQILLPVIKEKEHNGTFADFLADFFGF